MPTLRCLMRAPRPRLALAALWFGTAIRLTASDFDLGSLPAYSPGEAGLHGVVRFHDTELTEHLVHLWEDGFLKLHPLVRYSEYTVPTWFSGLCAGTADFAVTGHEAWRSDLKAFEGIYGYPPTEIIFATGGFDQRKGNTPGAIIFVNKNNPLTGLTLEQLDGILGAERSGGWVGTQWSTAAARGPEKTFVLGASWGSPENGPTSASIPTALTPPSAVGPD